MRTVIFDLDGTLADTSGDLIAAANLCFRGLGHGDLLDPNIDQATALRGGRAMLNLGFDRLGGGHENVDAQYPILIDNYIQDIDRYTVFYPGAIDAVKRLSTNGYAVGICTNKPIDAAELLMSKLGARDMFNSFIGAGSLAVRKPEPEPFIAAVEQAGGDLSRSLLVGDTLTDRETSRRAGVPSILVTFGPAAEDVRKMKPEGLLQSFDQLDDLVAALIG